MTFPDFCGRVHWIRHRRRPFTCSFRIYFRCGPRDRIIQHKRFRARTCPVIGVPYIYYPEKKTTDKRACVTFVRYIIRFFFFLFVFWCLRDRTHFIRIRRRLYYSLIPLVRSSVTNRSPRQTSNYTAQLVYPVYYVYYIIHIYIGTRCGFPVAYENTKL